MPAAAVKGIIISLAVIAALGVAVLENPQVQEWLEEQRKKIADLLRSLGEELDPASRRAAEAFAYEGRTPATDEGLRREAVGSRDAAAVATGRSLAVVSAESMGASRIRHIPVRGPESSEEADERRRKGKEYLARRNQQMIELRQRRKASEVSQPSTPLTPTSFDELVDHHGKLRSAEDAADEPLLADESPTSEDTKVKIESAQPVIAHHAESSSSAWQLGSQLADPFGDEHALERSITPRPPVPPKIELDRSLTPAILTSNMPGSFDTSPDPPMYEPVVQPHGEMSFEEPVYEPVVQPHDEMSFEEQLAIALSLSEAEQQVFGTVNQRTGDSGEDPELKAAIEASLREMDDNNAARRAPSAHREAHPHANNHGPSVDFGVSRQEDELAQPVFNIAGPPSPTRALTKSQTPRNVWEFDTLVAADPAVSVPSEPELDELYRVTPKFARARPVAVQAELDEASVYFDPVRHAADDLMELDAPSLISSLAIDARSPTLEPEPLIEIGQTSISNPSAAASNASTLASIAASDSGSDAFASVYGSQSRAHSQTRSDLSNIEVIDVVDDSDVDMLSEEGDGIVTPDSWTEVGSQDGESEADEFATRQ